MSDPLVPNYKTGVGRLVTDRFDFQDHIDGYDFRHKANQIDLVPAITISSISQTNVQAAIAALTAVVTPPTIQDATVTIKGIIKLAGDLGLTADSPKVIGLRGVPISSTVPSSPADNGKVLTFNGGIWSATTAGNAFVAAGDLSGNNVTQTIINLTGNGGGLITISGNTLQFLQGVIPFIKQETHATIAGKNLTIQAQSTGGTNLAGGDVIITGGAPGTGGKKGGVRLQLNANNIAQATEVVANQRVFGLFGDGSGSGSALTNTQMNTGTGDMVMFIGNALTIPSVNPSGGTILYSSGGQLFVRQGDSQQFSIGSIPNPSIWGTSGQQTYTSRSYVNTTGSPTAGNAFTIDFNTAGFTNSSIRVDVIFIGKRKTSLDAAQFNMSVGYVTSGAGAPTLIGTLTNSDPRTNGGASGWTIPNIDFSGTTLRVTTGGLAATNIWWFTIVQLSVSQES